MNKSSQKTSLIAAALLIVVGLMMFKKESVLGPAAQSVARERIVETHSVKPEEVKPVVSAPKKSLTFEEIQTKRSFAKLNLSAFYTAEISFYSDENRYSSDIVFMGYSPGEPEMTFKAGFLKPFYPARPRTNQTRTEDPLNYDTDIFVGQEIDYPADSSEKHHYSDLTEKINLEDYAKYCRKGCEASATGFEFMVAMPLGNGEQVDVWVINEKKVIRHVRDGLKL